MKSMSKWIPFGCLMFAGAVCAAQGVPQYSLKLFNTQGYRGFNALNNQGEIIGGDGPSPFIYRSGVFNPLNLSGPRGDRFTVKAINDASQIFGNDAFGTAFIYDKGQEQPLNFALKNGGLITAIDFNNRSQALASAFVDGKVHSLLYEDGVVTDAGPGYPTKLNSRGEIAGSVSDRGDAFFYTHGHTFDVGALAGPNVFTYGAALDSSGRVAVNVLKSDGTRGSVYFYSNGKLQPLLPLSSTVSSSAVAMNDCGDVIGYEAKPFLYTNGRLYYLTDLFPLNSKLKSLTLTPTRINNRGEIIGNAVNGTISYPFLLTPTVPEKCGFDVTIDNTPDSDTIRPGGEINYTIAVANLDSPTTQFSVKDELGLRTIFQSCSVSGTSGTCERTADKNVISVNLPNLAKGATATINLVTKGYSTAGDDQLIANTATVSSSGTPDYLSTAYTTVRESADIGIGMTLAENHGGTLHYVIQVANAGPDNSHAVLLSDTLPQGLNFVSATTTSGDCDHHPKVGSSGLLLCRIGNTPRQGTAQVDLIVQTATNAGSPVSNTATVLAKSVDSNQANNSATVTALVAP